MKKNILLLASILFLTSCTVNYNLDIDSNQMVEKIEGTITNEDIASENEETDINIYEDILNNDQNALIDGDSLYTKVVKETNNGFNYRFNYTYRDNFDDSRLINSCFEKHQIEEKENIYYIRLYGKFYCLFSNSITVNVTSHYGILDNNADRVNKNTYTWKIDDSDDVNLYLAIAKNVKYQDTDSSGRAFSTFQVIGLIILVILAPITYLLYRKRNNSKI